MKRLASFWAGFPAAHRKRLLQACAVYALLAGAVAVWVSLSAETTLKDWQARIPAAAGDVKIVYLTQEYAAAPTPVAGGQPYISLIVGGLGLSISATEKALDTLPQDVSLAFSPYAASTALLKKAQEMKFDTLISVPMETGSYPKDDPGPRALSSRLSDQENDDNLGWILRQGSGVNGVINYMGSRLLTDKRHLAPVFDALRKKNVFFVETPETTNSQARSIAAQTGLPYMAVDVQIDAKATDADIRAQLAKLEKIAQERGYAIGIASESYPLTFNIIKSWAAHLGESGIKLAPLTSMWKNKLHNDRASDPAPDTAPK